MGSSVGVGSVFGGGCLVVSVERRCFEQLSEACCIFSWNGFFIQCFAPMINTKDITDTIIKYAIITKKVGKVFEMRHDLFEVRSCSLSIRGLLLVKAIIGNHIRIVAVAFLDSVIE